MRQYLSNESLISQIKVDETIYSLKARGTTYEEFKGMLANVLVDLIESEEITAEWAAKKWEIDLRTFSLGDMR